MNIEPNLEVWATVHQRGQRIADLIEYAHEIFKLYGEDSNKWK